MAENSKRPIDAYVEMRAKKLLDESNGPVRMSLDVTRAMKQVLDELAEEDGTTLSEILRRSVGLYRTIKIRQKKGEQPAMVDSNDHLVGHIVLP